MAAAHNQQKKSQKEAEESAVKLSNAASELINMQKRLDQQEQHLKESQGLREALEKKVRICPLSFVDLCVMLAME